MQITHRTRMLAVVAVVLTAGCDEGENTRVAKVALDASAQQAKQNREMAKVNQTVAEATERLVAADAEARKEIVTVHREMQAERAGINSQRDQLELERKDIARQRRTESWIGPVIQASGILVVAGLAIGFCLLLVFGLRQSESADAELNELLVTELASEQRVLLPPSPAPPPIETDRADEANTSMLPSPND